MLGKEVYIGIIFYINMSIIVRSNSSYNGNNNVGDFPPGPVKNVNITPTYNSIKITVTKPDDTIINGITLSVFSYLRCVLKKNDMPLNVKDGINITVHSDQFNDGSYIITFNNLDHSSKYYIRFFTFSTNNQCNDSEEMIYETYTPEKPISSILNDNDWDTIIKVAESGQAQKYWKVGDEVDIQLSGTYNIKCTMQIWGFNHFNKVNNGNNKDNILFGCKDIYIKEKIHNGSGDDWWSYRKSYISETVLPNIYNSMDNNIKNHIKKVGEITYRVGTYEYSYLYDQTVFIPTMEIVGVKVGNEIGSTLLLSSIFSDNRSRIKKYNNTEEVWWLADGKRGLLALSWISSTGELGYPVFDEDTSTKHGVVFCFNI